MDAITLQPAAGAHGELDRPADGARLPPVEGRAAQEDSDSRLRPRHQPGNRCDGRLRGGESEIECAGHGGCGGARVADERRRGRADADQSQHAGSLRAGDSQDRRHHARQGRPALHGRREHERAGRQSAPRRLRRRRDAPEPAQDILDAARRRRARDQVRWRSRRSSSRFCRRRSSSPSPTARWASTTTGRNRWAACAPSTATSECLFAPWPTFWPTAPTVCARPPKTRC